MECIDYRIVYGNVLRLGYVVKITMLLQLNGGVLVSACLRYQNSGIGALGG